MFDKNTLDFARSKLSEALKKINISPPLQFSSVEAAEGYLETKFFEAMRSGNFSYDPIEGEIIIALDTELDVSRLIVGNLICRYFSRHGWDRIGVLSTASGIDKTRIRLQSDLLKSENLRD